MKAFTGERMRRSVAALTAAGLFFVLVLGTALVAQVKKDAQTGLDRIEGRVTMVDKNTSTITIKVTGSNATWQIGYGGDTTFTARNKPASIADVKDGARIVCLGKNDTASKLKAARIDIRADK
jgi:hypothetical protein